MHWCRAAAGRPARSSQVDGEIRGQREGGIRRGLQRGDPARHLLAQRAAGGAQDELLLVALGRRIGDEAEAADAADRMALDDDLAAAGDGGQQFLAVACLQAAHQMGGAAIDEAGGQPLMQGVGQHVLDFARASPANGRCPSPSPARAAM